MPFSFLKRLRPRRRRDDNNIVEPSPHPAVPKMRGMGMGSTPALPTQHNRPENNRHADTYKTEKHDSGCGFYAQPANASKTNPDQSHPDVQAFIERGVDPSDQEPAFTWQDIEPRADLDRDLNPPPISEFFNYELSPAEKDNLLAMHTQRQPEQLPPPSRARSAATIAQDHLSTTPEEQNHLSALERAVQARLGIPGALPSYNEVSGAVVVDHEGLPHFLSPQEEEERQASLRRAVEERMLGLPRRTTFSWAKASRGTSLPAYSTGRYK